MRQKGYRPESVEKFTETKTTDTHEEIERRRSFSYGITKPPRPEPEIKDQKPKKYTRKKLADELLLQYARDPKFKRALMFRYTIVSIGILILIISLIVSYQNYTSLASPEPSLEEDGYNFMIEFVDYDKLKLDNDYGTPAWDANKFLKLTSKDISTDFPTDLDYLIEVYDLSDYQLKYNRTIVNKLAWSSSELIKISKTTESHKFKISAFVNIFISPEEVHLARIEITVWEK